MIRTLLVAVNDSAAGLRAARFALALAHDLSARVVAVSVVDGAASELPRGPDGPPPGTAPDQLRAVHAVQQRLHRMAAQAGVDLEVRTVHGRVADQVLDQAAAVAADVVVVGRSERRGVRLALAQRTAEHVMEFSDVPVVVVPGG